MLFIWSLTQGSWLFFLCPVYEQFLCFKDPNSSMTFPLGKHVTVYSSYWNINVPELKLNLCLLKCFRTMLVWLLHYLHSFTFASIVIIFLRLASHYAFKSTKNLNFGSLITLIKTFWFCLWIHVFGLPFFSAYHLSGKLSFLQKIQTQEILLIVCPEEDASDRKRSMWTQDPDFLSSTAHPVTSGTGGSNHSCTWLQTVGEI